MKQPAILIALTLCSLTLAAQKVTTTGTDFWLAVEPNWSNTDVDTYTFAAGGKRACTVTISNPNTGWSHTMNVAANQVTSYTLPTSQNSQVWQAGSCTVSNTGLHITATDTIQFYFFNTSGSPVASDASTIFPTEALGVEYIAQCYPVNNTTYNSFAYFSILATEDSTTVEIRMAGNTNTSIHDGDLVTVLLNAGQVYQVLSTEYSGDLSGTIINSVECKPIAVFSGITLGRVPLSGLSSDHLFQQCFPTTSWAHDWILTASYNHNTDYYRVTAGADNCQIFINGASTPAATINTAETYEGSFSGVISISTSQPASVFQYLDSRHSTTQDADHGDASSFAPTPLNMMSRYTTFPTFPVQSRSPSTSEYYLNIIVPSAEVPLLRYNGSTISTSFSSGPTVSGTAYSYLRMPISFTGQHLLTTTGSGFIAHSYGAGENWDSYAFSLGGEDSNSIPFTPNYDTVDTVDITYCGNLFHFHQHTFLTSVDTVIPVLCSLVRLRLTLLTPTVINMDTTVCAGVFTWHGQTITHPGLFVDTVQNTDGCYTIYRLQVMFILNTTVPADDTSLCAESFTWHGRTFTLSGTYYDTISNYYGCDSIFTLHLTLNPSYQADIDTAICWEKLLWGDTVLNTSGTHHLHYTTSAGCDSNYTIRLTLLPYFDTTIDTIACVGTIIYGGQEYLVPGIYTIRNLTVEGCDSLEHLNIAAYPQYDTSYYISISDTEYYEWVDGHLYSTTTDTTLIATDRNGCDSIMRLHLTVNPIPRSPNIWVPNIFIPTAAENNRFKVFSQHVDKMTVTIFHRWGEQVCTFDGLTEDWDGTHKGIPCPEGAYVYLIKYHSSEIVNSATDHPIVGTVLLIR